MTSPYNGSRDQVDQDFDCLRECTYVEEADEVNLVVQQTVSSGGLGAQKAYPRFRKIVSQISAEAVYSGNCSPNGI